MQEVCERELLVLPSVCDAAGRLGIPDIFGAFMDIAAIHAELLGVGLDAMAARDRFWLTVKTRVDFFRRPRMGESVTLRTWPEAPEHLRCHRSYELRKGEELLAAGKTEWAVLNTKTNALVPIEDVYPAGLRFEQPTAIAEPFARIPARFGEEERFGAYRVRSTDIDVGGHVNNVAFVRALLGGFSNEELKALRPKRLEVIYRASCYEGEELALYRRPAQPGLDLAMVKDGKPALLAHLE